MNKLSNGIIYVYVIICGYKIDFGTLLIISYYLLYHMKLGPNEHGNIFYLNINLNKWTLADTCYVRS